ncbi:hypothetical protein N7495_008264 [Penicillium taxi]|uniref:uncharacterized protein n=1 Tax=Penicillium taxi TaxID=168475 RepID=UPI0025453F9C|nr:uncharacterized protein N7495_008264 [Penicillium taxi]KAJ5888223.1 hypothetical protein N7495_008264 [Penicillium taxi]
MLPRYKFFVFNVTRGSPQVKLLAFLLQKKFKLQTKTIHIMAIMKSIVLAQALLWSLASADASNLNPKGQGCVDPSGYLQCYEDNVNSLTTCLTKAKEDCDGDSYSTCVLACGNVQLAANIGCWLTSCWNQVRFILSA